MLFRFAHLPRITAGLLTTPCLPTTTHIPEQVDKEHRLTSRAGDAFGGAMDGVTNALSKKDDQDERWGSGKK